MHVTRSGISYVIKNRRRMIISYVTKVGKMVFFYVTKVGKIAFLVSQKAGKIFLVSHESRKNGISYFTQV